MKLDITIRYKQKFFIYDQIQCNYEQSKLNTSSWSYILILLLEGLWMKNDFIFWVYTKHTEVGVSIQPLLIRILYSRWIITSSDWFRNARDLFWL